MVKKTRTAPEAEVVELPETRRRHPTETPIDGILAELSSVAQMRPPPDGGPGIKRSLNPLRSRFIFKLRGPSDEEVRRKELTERPELPRSTKEVDDRSESYSVELPGLMEDRLNKIREFMLQELAPRMLAAQAGITQARYVVDRVAGAQMDDSTEHFFNQLMVKAANLRMCKFIAEYFGLQVEEVEGLLKQLDYTRQILIERPPLGNPSHDMEPSDERRPVRKSKEVLPRASGPRKKPRRLKPGVSTRRGDDV